MRWIMALVATAAMMACGGSEPTSTPTNEMPIAPPTPEGPAREVIVYTSHDQILSEPILDLFEEQTGIEVRAVYDTEATKTTGLVNRLLAEAERPRCDVFWNNEIVQTLRLKARGVTEAYHSENAAGILPPFFDPEGHWTGFAARARVIVTNTDAYPVTPEIQTYDQMLREPYAHHAGIALPLFGTTATHMAIRRVILGDMAFETTLGQLEGRGVQILDSNGQVCDAVARGALGIGWTDTDDVAVAIAEGMPVRQVLPRSGTIIIPNTVALIKGAPNPDEAKLLIDFLLSREVEQLLAEGPGAQIPLHHYVPTPPNVLDIGGLQLLMVDWDAVSAGFDDTMETVSITFLSEE